ncbi:transcriptional regulator domain-containing protein [Sphingomonas sp. NFR15]|uniref:transcriptional regulator domain-containing protein n=1 Tax=Sphingomonas sp. NFR15 TaxID=1566282 RepID=UPI0035245CCB
MTRYGPPRPGFDWRDPRPYSSLRGIDRAGLMWEWLRRDPCYVGWYTRASTATRGADDAMPWGLHFRGTSRPPGPGGAAHLACRSRSRDNRRHRHPRRSVEPRQHPRGPDRTVACDRDRHSRARARRPVRRLAPYPARH